MLVFSKLLNKNLEKTNNQNGNSLSLEVLPTHPSLTKCISVGYLPLHRRVPRCPVIVANDDWWILSARDNL